MANCTWLLNTWKVGWVGAATQAMELALIARWSGSRRRMLLFGKLHPYPAKVTCPKRNGVCVGESGRTHPVGAGLKPDIARGVVLW